MRDFGLLLVGFTVGTLLMEFYFRIQLNNLNKCVNETKLVIQEAAKSMLVLKTTLTLQANCFDGLAKAIDKKLHANKKD